MLKRMIFPALFILLGVSCANPDEKLPASKDSSACVATVPTPAGHVLGQDTVKLIDSIVQTINEQIKQNQLKKKTIEGMDNAGGYVYGYYYPDNSLAYIYSSSGAEAGRSERISFYKNN